MNKVLVLAVHPDDETLGCGGTLLRHKDNGDKIYWLIITRLKDKMSKRNKEIERVANMYGFDAVKKLEIFTGEVKAFPREEMIKKISVIFKAIKPNVLYFPFKGDVKGCRRW